MFQMPSNPEHERERAETRHEKLSKQRLLSRQEFLQLVRSYPASVFSVPSMQFHGSDVTGPSESQSWTLRSSSPEDSAGTLAAEAPS
eukprot:8118582-Pyramimonas_sp.AAC.1